MKGRHFWIACMLIVASVLFFVPMTVKADDNQAQIEHEILDYGYTKIVQDVLSADNPMPVLNSLDEESINILEEHLSEEERREFCAIYQYLLLTDIVKTDKTIITSHVLDTELTFYKEMANEETAVEVDLTDIKQRAFDVFKAEMLKKDAEWEIKTGGASGAETYIDYLQTQTTIDVKGLAEQLTTLGTATDEAKAEVYEGLRTQLYEIYGIPYEQGDMPTEEQVHEKKGVPEEIEDESQGIEEELRSTFALKGAAVARVGSQYYSSFNQAFNAMPSGGTIYVLRDCIATHIVTEKSFSLYPEGGNVKITFQDAESNAAGVITTEEGWHGRPTWNLGGNGNYTLTLDANKKGSSGALACYGATINLKSGIRVTNAAGNGVWNDSGITNVYDNAKIYNNGSHGIATLNTINVYGGEIYGNAYDGIRAHKVINLSGGSIYDNGECGVHPGDSACKLTMTGGSSFRNRNGVGTFAAESSIYIQGGDIYENTHCGVLFPGKLLKVSGKASIRNNRGSGIMMSGGEAYIEGGSIRSNISPGNGGGICVNGGKLSLSGGAIVENSAKQGNGVYFNGTQFEMGGAGTVDQGNDVYLQKNKYITVTNALLSPIAAKLTFADYWNGRKAATVTFGEQRGSLQYEKFQMTAKDTFCLRPGDYQDKALGVSKEDIVLSTRYQVSYEKNINREVTNMPSNTAKFWNEKLSLSGKVPIAGNIRFFGWSENWENQIAQYQPNVELPPTQNRNITLYALWGPQIRVIYCGNGNEKGTEQSETITARKCTETNGYSVRKNTGFTQYEKTGHTLTGWSIKKDTSSKETEYQETKSYKVSFEELLNIASKQYGGVLPIKAETVEVRLYAVWDEAPVITAEGIREFYEGTEVTGQNLLENVRATDKEDGDITKKISIAGIEYGAGKWDGKNVQSSYAEDWKGQTVEAVRLDTWFEQLQEKDSPVEHNVIYQIIDSAGNQVTLKWLVKVKFNEYPKIEAVDRYFTLEEAQSGKVTEKVLLENALTEGKVKVTDTEDDQLYPGRIIEKMELIDFRPDEFQSFTESGYMTVTYTVKDSMGPKGDGKETYRQCKLYIVKDGEVKKADPVTYVRFIDKKYYEKNLDANINETKNTNSTGLKNGGLLPSSKWYQDPEYRKILTSLWSNDQKIAGKWKIGAKDVMAIKTYVEEHGIGNGREQTALYGFLKQFPHLQIL